MPSRLIARRRPSRNRISGSPSNGILTACCVPSISRTACRRKKYLPLRFHACCRGRSTRSKSLMTWGEVPSTYCPVREKQIDTPNPCGITSGFESDSETICREPLHTASVAYGPNSTRPVLSVTMNVHTRSSCTDCSSPLSVRSLTGLCVGLAPSVHHRQELALPSQPSKPFAC